MALTDKIEIPRRTMVLFFVIDTSGSMEGKKIGSVNAAIEEVIPAIKEVSDENADAQIKIAVLEFSSGATWHTPSGPVPADQFRWNDLDAGGVTDFGAACKTLNEKLSTKAFMQEATGSFAPAIFLLSDGDPTDDWQSALAALKQNNWFKAAVKVAVAIGDDVKKDVLKE
ncbi:MAG: VWA domain-containing protein, partial [Treponema sp.]|nr:VWA domain-containing protein [Treponema sp.]